MLSDVFHSFTKDHFVHEFKEILLKIVGSLGSKLGVEIYVGFNPGRFGEFNCSMDFLKYQSMIECLFQGSNVNDVILLII